MTVPNEQDTLRTNPAARRLTWEAPDPIVRSEPIKHAWDAKTCAEVCHATDFESGQLIGKMAGGASLHIWGGGGGSPASTGPG